MGPLRQLTENLPERRLRAILAGYTRAMRNPMKRFMYGGIMTAVVSQMSGFAWASGPGTTSADVLKMGLGVRAIGMGEAYVAQADDASSLYWNPAGLALMQERQASFMYSQLVRDMKYQNANLGIPLENGAIGGSLSYLNYGSVQGYDTSGNATGDQSVYSGVGTLGAAWLGNQWSAGVNAKGIQEKLADAKASGAAFDMGAMVIYPKPVMGGTLRLGAVVQNVGNGLQFLQQRDPLPRSMRVGLAAVQMLNRKLNVSMDYGMPKDDDAILSGGAEYWLSRHLALRGGFVNNHTEGAGMRGGIGLRIKGVSFDYAYAGQGELGMNHRYEISFRFGEPRPILNAEERKILQQAKAAMRQQRYEQATLLFDSLIEMEPHYKPARRHIKISMAKLEDQQAQQLARHGKTYDPSLMGGQAKAALPEMDDLEQLLNLGTPRSAQKAAPQKGGKQ